MRETKEEFGIDIKESSAQFVEATLRYYEDCLDILDV